MRERVQRFPDLTSRRLWREIRDLGFTGGYSTVTDFLRAVRPPAAPTAFERRFETPPGRQAQVDFAFFRVRFEDEPGAERIVWLFSLVLRSVYFTTLAELIASLAKAEREGSLRERIRFLCRPQLLVR